MTGSSFNATVLHVGEAASTAQSLIAAAAGRGMHWDHIPPASEPREWRGASAKLRKAALGIRWVGEIAIQARQHDIVHMHSASMYKHSRFANRRFVLHCHGTDVRTAQYESGWRPVITQALTLAEHVFYATPDLAEHVLPHRPDAQYLPVPITTSLLPEWLRPERPRIVFASRWERAKGIDRQLECARALVGTFGDRVSIEGLDSGADARLAADAGVTLIPVRDRATYLDWLASSSAVVGQSTGAIGASELEALGCGSPLLMAVELPLYRDDPPPVLGSDIDSVVEVAGRLVGDDDYDPALGRDWVRRVHGVEGRLDEVLDVYRDVLARRRSRNSTE